MNQNKQQNPLKLRVFYCKVQGNRQISNFIIQDVDIILHHEKLVGVAI